MGRLEARLVEILDPCVARCILEGLANYSAVARKFHEYISSLTGRDVSEAALKTSLIRRRWSEASACYGLTCERLLRILAGSRVELRTGIVVVTVSKLGFLRLRDILQKLLFESRFFQLMQGVASFTIIVDEEHAGPIREAASGEVIDYIEGQAAITLVSPREILETPGVLAYITTLLAVNGINVTQVVSCYTDTVLVVPRHQADQAYRLVLDAVETAKMLLTRHV